MNGRGESRRAADTKLGVSELNAVNPAAIQRPNPANNANLGNTRAARDPLASNRDATIDITIAAHSSQDTISNARIAIGVISAVDSWRSR